MISKLRNPGFARRAAGVGALLLAVCIGITTYRNTHAADFDAEACTVDPKAPGAAEPKVVAVSPGATTLNRRICFVVEGVSAEPAEGDATLYVFLDGQAMPAAESTAAKPVQQTVTARKIPDQQAFTLRLEAPASATPALSGFWRDVARVAVRPDKTWGQREVQVGVALSATALPPADATKTLTLVMLYPLGLLFGGLALAAFALSFWSLALTTTILRDNPRTLVQTRDEAAAANAAAQADPAATVEAKAAAAAKAADAEARRAAWGDGTPAGSYSLARTQMALWLFLTVSGFIYIWFGVGQTLDVMTAQVVTLLGIQAVTGVAAVMVDTESAAAKRDSRSFLADILNSDDGPKVHRVQALAWTVVLALIFAWNVLWNFIFVPFDQSLLLLMGVTQSVYVGFKYQEETK